MCAIIEVETLMRKRGSAFTCIAKDTYKGKITYLLPIQGPLHFDKKFGVPEKHYHIDGRFLPIGATGIFIHSQHDSTQLNGLNNNGVFPSAYNKGFKYKLVGLMPRILKAVYPTTGLNISEGAFYEGERYNDWYNTYLGRDIVNGLCPHNRATMLLENGKLRCPLHDLHGCPKTNKIIQHPKANA